MAEPPRLRGYSYGALSAKFGPAYSPILQFSISCDQNSTRGGRVAGSDQ